MSECVRACICCVFVCHTYIYHTPFLYSHISEQGARPCHKQPEWRLNEGKHSRPPLWSCDCMVEQIMRYNGNKASVTFSP